METCIPGNVADLRPLSLEMCKCTAVWRSVSLEMLQYEVAGYRHVSLVELKYEISTMDLLQYEDLYPCKRCNIETCIPGNAGACRPLSLEAETCITGSARALQLYPWKRCRVETSIPGRAAVWRPAPVCRAVFLEVLQYGDLYLWKCCNI
jgi:hypothetical protein